MESQDERGGCSEAHRSLPFTGECEAGASSGSADWLSHFRSPVERNGSSSEKNNGMGWLAFGVVYSIVYATAGWVMRGQPAAWSWFRAVALLIPPMTGAVA